MSDGSAREVTACKKRWGVMVPPVLTQPPEMSTVDLSYLTR